MSRSCSVLLLALLFISNSHSFQSSPHRHHPTTQRYVSLTASVTSFATASDSPPLVNWDWKKVATDVFEEDDRPIILFDGLCNLCHAGVNFAFDNDPDANFRFASLQSAVGQSLLLQNGRNPQDIDSIVLVNPDGKAFLESEAVLGIALGLEGDIFQFVGTVGQVFPPFMRNAILKQVSEHRHVFGVADQCRVDFDGEFERRFVSEPKGLEGV